MLSVDNLTLHYGQSQILHGISLTAEPGKVTAVTGTNGVGKTSLLKAIAGRHPYSGGAIALDGEPLNHLNAFQAGRAGIAYVPQGREVFPLMTVQENLETGFACLPKSEHKVPDHIFELFPILKDFLHRRGGDLSGGQQQQLAIARALITKPRVLLLDEPTEGIQPSIIKDIAKALNEIRKLREITVVVSEQVLSFAMDVADRLFVIEGGRLVHESARAQTDEAHIKQFLSV